MKRLGPTAAVLGTLAVWCVTAWIIGDRLLIWRFPRWPEWVGLSMVLAFAVLGSAAIWWCPRMADGLLAPPERRDQDRDHLAAEELASPRTRGRRWPWIVAMVCAAVTVVKIPLWVIGLTDVLRAGQIPYGAIVPVLMALGVPLAYLAAFSLWHWRARYRGRNAVAWAILFAAGIYALFFAPPVPSLISLAYFVLHIVPDLRGTGAYASDATSSPPARAAVAGRPLAVGACYVSGWVLILIGVLHATITAAASLTIWNDFQKALPGAVGMEITETLAGTLWVGAQVNKTLASSSLVAVVSAALGALLIHASFRLRPGKGAPTAVQTLDGSVQGLDAPSERPGHPGGADPRPD